MEFKWEKIHEQKEDGVYWFATYRAKVFGGWVMRTFDMTRDKARHYDSEDTISTSESMVFVADPNHEWIID